MRTLWGAPREGSRGARGRGTAGRAAILPLRAWLFRGAAPAPAGAPSLARDGAPPSSLVRVSAFRHTEADVFPEAEAVYVLADLRGVSRREDVRVRVAHDILVVEAVFRGGPHPRWAAKEILLPFAPRKGDVGFDLRNGILEIRIARAAGELGVPPDKSHTD